MQANYKKGKVIAAAARAFDHYRDEAENVQGKDLEFTLRKKDVTGDIYRAAKLAEPGSVLLNQAEIKLLAAFWDKPGAETN